MTKTEGCAALLDVVRRNLELVAVWIAEINRVCDLVILGFEFDSALFQFPLRSEKIFPVRTKGQMKHSNFAVRGRFRLLVRREQGDPGISFANKSWHPIPHPIMKPLKSEDVDVPFGRSFDVANTHRDVINAFELHASLGGIYRIAQVEAINARTHRTPKGGSVVLTTRQTWMRTPLAVLPCRMPSDPPEKPKSDDEARAREKSNKREKNDELQPSRKKIPEGEGNLRRRAEWFQKRTGGTE